TAGRRGDRLDRRAAGHRRCGRRPGAGAARQRHPLWRRRVQGACARRARRADRKALRLWACPGWRGGGAPGDPEPPRRVRPDDGPRGLPLDLGGRRRPPLPRRLMLLYRLLVTLGWPLVWLVFRPRVQGREHVRVKGGLVICPTHLSGFDALAIAFAM